MMAVRGINHKIYIIMAVLNFPHLKGYRVIGMAWAVVLLLSGCTATVINPEHPLRVQDESLAANLYFIRPYTERPYGFADNPVVVEMNKDRLLDLAKGEYTLVRMIPREYVMVLKNLTEVGPDWQVKELSRSYRFSFQAGRTYFIVITPIDGEFRGVTYKAENVDLIHARIVSEHLRPVAGARNAPIATLGGGEQPPG